MPYTITGTWPDGTRLCWYATSLRGMCDVYRAVRVDREDVRFTFANADHETPDHDGLTDAERERLHAFLEGVRAPGGAMA